MTGSQRGTSESRAAHSGSERVQRECFFGNCEIDCFGSYNISCRRLCECSARRDGLRLCGSQDLVRLGLLEECGRARFSEPDDLCFQTRE